MKIIKQSVLASAVFLALAISVSASARPAYNYVGVGYMRQDVSDRNCIQDGLVLEGSLLTNEHMYVRALHVDVTSDNASCGFTMTSLSGGVRSDFGANSSVYGLATLMARDSGNDTDPGVGLQAGMRSILSSGLELKFFMGYDIVDDFDESYLGAGINYYLSRSISFMAEAFVTNEDTSGVSAGLRFNF